MVIAEISVVPIGTETPSVSEYVAKAIEIIKQQERVNYQLTAMGTLLEGELGDVLAVMEKMHNSIFDEKIKRIPDSSLSRSAKLNIDEIFRNYKFHAVE